MNHRTPFAVTLATLLIAAASFAASPALGYENPVAAASTATTAHPLGQHPAILVKRQAQHIDPNTFIVAHPAGLAIIDGPTPATALAAAPIGAARQ